MRTTFNRARLRKIALVLLILGGCFIVIGAGLFARLLAEPVLRAISYLFGASLPPIYLAHNVLALGAFLSALPLFAAGLAFWTLSRDRQAGVTIDRKGLLLNLGQSSAFVAWSNIERVGVTWRGTSVLAFGSRWQLGIALRDVRPYIQSYEERLPKAPGPIERGLQLVRSALRASRPPADAELALHLATCRQRTGYDIVIPEALLGGSAADFAALIEEGRARQERRVDRSSAPAAVL